MARGGQSAAREPATEPLPSSPIHVAEAQVAGQTPLGAALLLIFPLRLRPDSELPKNHSMGLFNSWTLLHGAKKKGSKLCQPPFRLPKSHFHGWNQTRHHHFVPLIVRHINQQPLTSVSQAATEQGQILASRRRNTQRCRRGLEAAKQTKVPGKMAPLTPAWQADSRQFR